MNSPRPNPKPGCYTAEIAAGSLKLPQSRIVANLLLQRSDNLAWRKAIVTDNLLQARSPATAIRLGRLVRQRLETMTPPLWKMVRDAPATVATQACLAAAVKHSRLLGDFMDLVLREQYRLFRKTLEKKLWWDFLRQCQARCPAVQEWSAATQKRLGSTVFQTLAQAGYLQDTHSFVLQRVFISRELTAYLRRNHEDYVLRCITVAT